MISPFHHLFPSSVVSSHIVHIPCSGLILSFLFSLLLFSMFVFISVWCHYVWRPRALVVRRLSKSTDLIWFDLMMMMMMMMVVYRTTGRMLRPVSPGQVVVYAILRGVWRLPHVLSWSVRCSSWGQTAAASDSGLCRRQGFYSHSQRKTIRLPGSLMLHYHYD